jgi:hypothetical protein
MEIVRRPQYIEAMPRTDVVVGQVPNLAILKNRLVDASPEIACLYKSPTTTLLTVLSG